MEPLFHRIGPLDDGVALRVCLLLLRVYTQLQETGKAQNVLGLLEKMYGNLVKTDDRDSNSDQMVDGEKEAHEIANSGELVKDPDCSIVFG